MKSAKLDLVIGTVAVVACAIAVPQPTQAETIELDYLCQRFPLNSRCKDYKPPQAESEPNSAQQVLKIRLDKDGPNNEVIRIEINGNTVRLLHTTQVVAGISRLINAGLGAAPIPIPFDINFYNWRDHQTLRSSFEPDTCPARTAVVPVSAVQSVALPADAIVVPVISQSTLPTACTVTGIDQLVLPPEMDMYAGQFMVEYAERKTVRSIKFRLPAKTSQSLSR